MAERRFIDANNLIEEIREERCYNCRNFKDMKCDYCGTADYIYMIEDMPAADVAPVRHGQWEPGNPICPVCGGNKFKDLDADIWCDWQPDFCPNCGAKMDGGADHDA